MRVVTSVLDVLGLALLVVAGWWLAGWWLALAVAGGGSLWVSRSLSGARPVLDQVLNRRPSKLQRIPTGRSRSSDERAA